MKTMAKEKVNNWYYLAVCLMITAMMQLFIPKGIRPIFLIYKMLVSFALLFWALDRNKYMEKAVAPIVFFALAMPTAAIVSHSSFSVILQSTADLFLFLDMFLITWKFIQKYDLLAYAKIIFHMLLVYMVFTDLSVLKKGAGLEYKYLIGTKFRVAYLHWFLCILALYLWECEKNFRYKALYIGLVLWSFVLIKYASCSTGLLGMMLIVAMGFMLNSREIRRFLNPRYLLLYMAIAFALFTALKFIVSLSYVELFIQNVLGRRSTLTGRFPIYNSLNGIVARRPWFGYGYENTAVADVVGYGNAQNGFYEIAIEYGLVGVVGLLLATALCTLTNKRGDPKIMPFSIMTVALTVASIIETPFNNYFFICLAIIYAQNYKYNRNTRINHTKSG